MATGIISSGTAAASASFTYTPSSNGKVNVSAVSSMASASFSINNASVWNCGGAYAQTNFSFYVSAGTTYTFTTYYIYYVVSVIEETS